ncbi:hypothetical protein Aple_012600 [Acrocarpospora pleiomorpha]|uniref:Uncharacterized protein n=1 Tax=Acrocarpospora pleiomorpha TaxID=90975 RepID=A0A5M3X9F3_9ACTN|nr:hypothetical protein [Acrocarpospora pleiomorpha]GES18365.1 hypothetical protein Aple_012600 [Acrocarpospora pleiomorpha]
MGQEETSKLAAVEETVRHLRPLLEDVWRALDTPDTIGGRWEELRLGSPASSVFVCVDAMGNVLHARYGGGSLSIVYLPGWFFEVASSALGRLPELSTTTVVDVKTAQPLSFDLTVVNKVRGATETVKVRAGGRGETGWSFGDAAEAKTIEYELLPFGYAFTPARGFCVTESPPDGDQTLDPAALYHWSAMRLRIAAAPGVGFTQEPLLGEAALSAARAAYVAGEAEVTCDQALIFEFERHRHPMTLPPLGAPLRPTPLAEPDIVASAVAMRHAFGEQNEVPKPLAVQQTRPDGVDLLLMKPDLRRPPKGRPWGWQPDWMVKAAYALDDFVFSLVISVLDTYVEWLGGLPETAPALIRVRVDPASAADRFAYRLDYLDPDGNPVAEPPARAVPGGPSFRLTVVRTEQVRVFLDDAIGAAGVSDLEGIVEYRETVADFDDVPLAITADEQVDVADLRSRPATIQEILQIVLAIGEFIPHPAIQAMYDLRDLGSVGAYVLTGKDLYGEPMSGLEAALTLGGVLVPEVAERAGRSLLASGRRVLTVGDNPTPRLRDAAEAAESADAALAKATAERAEASSP